ncbi:hypothetical protein BCR34DRAFT_583356 [Clohesyomyces aquaticus]|uniref:Uncharacterized protein n=1 Tax=Clohesyomyces aquaticus TaxID=1231657 RepID=A0A1Y2A5M0_9PLEO|nr:hypothetical protein BCR34DRAFT_583356 [Clohesyomyces aquaticus]
MPIKSSLNSILNSRFRASPYVAFDPLVHDGYYQRTEGSRTRIDLTGNAGDPGRISQQPDENISRPYLPTHAHTRGGTGVQVSATNAVYGDGDLRRPTQVDCINDHRYTDTSSRGQGLQHLGPESHSYALADARTEAMPSVDIYPTANMMIHLNNPHSSQAVLQPEFGGSYIMDREYQGPPGGHACDLIDDADPEHLEAFEMDSSSRNRSIQWNLLQNNPGLEYERITACINGRNQEHRIPVDGQRSRVGDTRLVPVPVHEGKDGDEDTDSLRTRCFDEGSDVEPPDASQRVDYYIAFPGMQMRISRSKARKRCDPKYRLKRWVRKLWHGQH